MNFLCPCQKIAIKAKSPAESVRSGAVGTLTACGIVLL